MSTTSSTPYVPYQAYKSKRHSRVLSNPTPPAGVPNVNTSINANAGINGTGEPHGQTKHASWSSADFALRVNGGNTVGGASGAGANVVMPWALKGDVAPSTTNLASSVNENGGDTGGSGAGIGISAAPGGNAKSDLAVKTRPASVMIIPQHQVVPEKDRTSSSEPTSPGVASSGPTVASVMATSVNGGPPTTDTNVEPANTTGAQSSPIYSRSNSNGSSEPPGISSEPNGSSTSPTASERSAGKAPVAVAPETNTAGPSSSSSSPPSPLSARSGSSNGRTRRTSTFRYVPLRPPNTNSKSTAPRTSSPLRPTSMIQPHTTHNRAASSSGLSPLASARQLGDQPSPASIHSELAPETTARSGPASRPGISNVNGSSNTHNRSVSMSVSPPAFQSPSTIPVAPRINPPQRTSSLSHPLPVLPPNQSVSPAVSPTPAPASGPTSISTTGLSRVQSPSPIPQRTPSTITTASTPTSVPSTPTSTATSVVAYKTVYRPGFQPRGVYRPLTDDFLALRKRARDEGRIELTRLERRFEKLVELHFSPSKAEGEEQVSNVKGKEKVNVTSGGIVAPGLARRASSFFEELGELRGKGATELWRSVLENRSAVANGGKGDIRSAEQRITPWEEDADVSACPHCSASFHPLTNRKHHCRLCGRIICSLPVKKPQRPVPCSLLFVSDPKTGRIEEVTEGVDYGVRPRTRTDSNSGKGGSAIDSTSSEEKFLKGVRICRECKPIMLRQQYRQEAKRVPAMLRLYEVLVSLESEIEELLPPFQELMLSLSNNPDEAPTKEASAARKHLLECFADYDAIAKRIRKIPCPGGPGGSQDRVQAAIQARANMFLQKNMFPLQSLPKPKRRASAKADGSSTPPESAPSQVIDPDSELAQALQPLLEQEALLESFVEEATTHRKFEDAKTLKANLAEIRAEIDRIVIQAEGGTR